MTLIEFVAHYWAFPEFAREHPLPKPLDGMVRALGELGATVGGIALRAAQAPASPGYGPWLAEHGTEPILARMMAQLIVRHGRRIAEEKKRETEAVEAIRFLAKSRRSRPAITRRIEILLAAWEETSVFDPIFEDSGLDVFEFVRLLKTAAQGGNDALSRLRELAATLTSRLSIPRGPKVTAASAAHEFFLREAVARIAPRAYTWDDTREDFTDSVTQATRLEFGDGEFDPRPARHRSKAKRRQ